MRERISGGTGVRERTQHVMYIYLLTSTSSSEGNPLRNLRDFNELFVTLSSSRHCNPLTPSRLLVKVKVRVVAVVVS